MTLSFEEESCMTHCIFVFLVSFTLEQLPNFFSIKDPWSLSVLFSFDSYETVTLYFLFYLLAGKPL